MDTLRGLVVSRTLTHNISCSRPLIAREAKLHTDNHVGVSPRRILVYKAGLNNTIASHLAPGLAAVPGRARDMAHHLGIHTPLEAEGTPQCVSSRDLTWNRELVDISPGDIASVLNGACDINNVSHKHYNFLPH